MRFVSDHRIRHALLADENRQGTCIDASERDDAARLQPIIQMIGGTIARRRRDVRLEDRADGAGAIGRGQVLDVFLVGADIADMRKGEGDDLAGIGGIREDFLIPGEGGVKADLRFADTRSAKAFTFDDRSVSEHQQGRWLEFGPACGLRPCCLGTCVCSCRGGHAVSLSVGSRRCLLSVLGIEKCRPDFHMAWLDAVVEQSPTAATTKMSG